MSDGATGEGVGARVHLKTLTLRGFKSFASATTLTFEPGVTCVVGPNGSGKSNVVDALAWVMGEQGAKSLRGGKMEDVIFAGTSTRQALGRAEVSLTIDNSDGALPIDYTEVTISRTLFRSGGSDYAINGQPARLLDVQELLSDSGLGREMHVIVGQGQLDTVLRATPEDRRGFIEEAAGVLKHRRRKEKAQRKLTGMQANLDRLADLTAEVAKQLGPLGRQAEAARKAQTVQRDLRDARARLLADDLARLDAEIAAESSQHTGLRTELGEVEERRKQLDAEAEESAIRITRAAEELDRARELCFTLSAGHQNASALARRASERAILLAQDRQEESRERSPEELEAAAEKLAGEIAEQERQHAALEDARARAAEAKQTADEAFRAEDRRVARLASEAADRRERAAQLAGRVATAASRVEAAEAELQRQRDLLDQVQSGRLTAQAEFDAAEQEAASVDVGEEDLDAAHEAAIARQEEADAALAVAAREHEQAVGQERELESRLSGLSLGLDRVDAAAELLASGEPGVLGRLAELMTIEAGAEAAIGAALGQHAEGLVLESQDLAGSLLDRIAEQGGSLAVAYPAVPGDAAGVPAGWRAARDLVTGVDAGTDALLDALLTGVAVPPAGVTPSAEELAGGIVAVTMTGQRFERAGARSADDGAELLRLRSAAEETREELRLQRKRIQRMAFAMGPLRHAAESGAEEVERTLADLHDSDARITHAVEHLGRLGQQVRAAVVESERIEGLISRSERELEGHRAQLAAAREARVTAEDSDAEDEAPDPEERERLAESARLAAETLMEATLSLRAAGDQLGFVRKRREGMVERARRERAALEEAAKRRAARAAGARRAEQVAALATRIVEAAAALETTGVAQREARVSRLEQLRSGRGELDESLREVAERHAALTNAVHRDEVARQQLHARREGVVERAAEKLALSPEALVEGYGPHHEVPDPSDPEAPGRPYVRAEQEKRLRQAEKLLERMGQINPLALEEFAALEERHRFLETQLVDLQRSRSDLQGIMRDVDRHVQEIFAAAYADTAEQFSQVFPVLFPGGEGRLVLTDPEDMLTTGIEVEARPAGKRVKRLSLLSGGERSLTAVALLVSIFKARPSPFYVMDEVEAALDDLNLSRLISIVEELRASSQLIIITHQKRTMEVADALYGVTMRGDGVSQVISQRIERGERRSVEQI